MQDLNGRVCILTGASRGVGAELAPRLAAAGLKLALVARDRAGLDAVAEQIQGRGGVAEPFPADLNQIESLAVLLRRVAEDLGPPVVLVNNAGVEGFQHFDQATVTGIARSTTINLAAPLALTRLLVPYMQAAGEGQVVTMASTAGLGGGPCRRCRTGSRTFSAGPICGSSRMHGEWMRSGPCRRAQRSRRSRRARRSTCRDKRRDWLDQAPG